MRRRSRTLRMTSVADPILKEDSINVGQGSKIADIIEDSDDYHPVLPFLSQHLEFSIPSETRYMHGVLSYVMKHLPEFGTIEPHHSNIYVALNEAISNAIRHGHKNDPNKRVQITADMDSHVVRFTISDQGEGFDSSHVPDPTLPDNLLQPGGRGVLLIKHLMDETHYNDRGNQVTMIKYADHHE
ncbi:MAG TPA: ATP-binding protein [Blastocatellia bacterium]|nr:ATP-binding protein [Blastocatellia bacterium]